MYEPIVGKYLDRNQQMIQDQKANKDTELFLRYIASQQPTGKEKFYTNLMVQVVKGRENNKASPDQTLQALYKYAPGYVKQYQEFKKNSRDAKALWNNIRNYPRMSYNEGIDW